MLLELSTRHSTNQRLAKRCRILLALNGKAPNFRQLAAETGCDHKTVKTWYLRGVQANEQWAELLENLLKEPGHAGKALRKRRLAARLLDDLPRSGAPPTYTPEQYTQIIALALTSPEEHGIIATHWSSRELTDVVHQKGIAKGISIRQVQRFLEEADLKPHKIKYWLNPKIDDPGEYERQAKAVCDCYLQAQELRDQGVRVVSTDEKTGIQALERIAPAKPMSPGSPERIEFEYRRHGTRCLIPSFDVASGKIIRYHLDQQRTAEDFANHIIQTVETSPSDKWIFIADQLNTHKSEELVRLIAELSGFAGDLGEKGKSGILKNVASRTDFLSNREHRVCFVYTPKHCSWLNQVEIWFGILARKILKRASFASLAELESRIHRFIDFFNRTMARPFKWTCTGAPLRA